MIRKIHHISSIVSHAQEDIDFYASFLALRLVKQTLNYDDLKMFHLYYGNQDASENIWTTFPIVEGAKARLGGGQVARSYFKLPSGSLDFWEKRFEKFSYPYHRVEDKLFFQDPDGLKLVLLEGKVSQDRTWPFNGVSKNQGFQEIVAVDIYSQNIKESLQFFQNILGLKAMDDSHAYRIDLLDKHQIYFDKKDHPRGHIAVGSVHHLALSVDNLRSLKKYARLLDSHAYPHSGIKNRKYFHSLYVREPGGLLIELATEGPGMLVDERLEDLGQKLQYPAHASSKDRREIEKMMPLFVKEIDHLRTYSYRNLDEYQLLQEKERLKKEILKERASDGSEKRIQALKKAYRAIHKEDQK